MSVGLKIALIIIGAIGLTVGFAKLTHQEPKQSENDPATAERLRETMHELFPGKVTFEVEGARTSSADLTIRVGSATSQAADRAVPLQSKGGKAGLRTTAEPGDFLYLSAQRKDDNSGTITCRITVDGEVIAENSSVGAFTIATCSGSAPGG